MEKHQDGQNPSSISVGRYYNEMLELARNTSDTVGQLETSSNLWRSKAEKLTKEKELSLTDDFAHFPVSELSDLSAAFEDMLIDLPSSATYEAVEDELKVQEDAHSLEERKAAFELARTHGLRRLDRLVLSYQAFRTEELAAARKQQRLQREELGYDLMWRLIKQKRAAVKRTRAELSRKQNMAEEAREDDLLSADQIRDKYESAMQQEELRGLLQQMEERKSLVARALAKKKATQDSVTTTKVNLAQMLYDMERAVAKSSGSRFAKKRRVVGIDDDGRIQYEEDFVDELDTTQEDAIRRHEREHDALEGILKNNVKLTNEYIESEKRCIQLQSQIDALLASERYGGYLRLKRFVEGKEQKIIEDGKITDNIKRYLLEEFGLSDIDTPKGQTQFRRLLERRQERELMRQHRNIAKIEATFGGANLEPKPKEEQDHIINVKRAVRTMDQDTIGISADAMDRLAYGMRLDQRSIFTEEERQIKSTFDLQDNNMHDEKKEKPALFSTILRKTYGKSRADELTQDYGLQAAAEHLQVLDNLLKDGSRKQIEQVRTNSSYKDVEAMKSRIAKVLKNIGENYRELKTLQRSMGLMVDTMDGSFEEREELRKKFLKKIDGRNGYPRTIDGRQNEVDFLLRRVPDLKVENEQLATKIAVKKVQIEDNKKNVSKRSSVNAISSKESTSISSEPDAASLNLHAMISAVELPELDEEPLRAESSTDMTTAVELPELNEEPIRAESGTDMTTADGTVNSICTELITPDYSEEIVANSLLSVSITTGAVYQETIDGNIAKETEKDDGETVPNRSEETHLNNDMETSSQVSAADSDSIMTQSLLAKSEADTIAKVQRQTQREAQRERVNTLLASEKLCAGITGRSLTSAPRQPVEIADNDASTTLSSVSESHSESWSSFNVISREESGLMSIPTLSDHNSESTTAAIEPTWYKRMKYVHGPDGQLVPYLTVPVANVSLDTTHSQTSRVPFRHRPYSLTLSRQPRNLAFGGHRLLSEEILTQEVLMELPDMYSRLSGKNSDHWSIIPTMPGDPLKPFYRSTKAEMKKLRRRRERIIAKMERQRVRQLQEQAIEERAKAAEAKRRAKVMENAMRQEEYDDLSIYEDDGSDVDSAFYFNDTASAGAIDDSDGDGDDEPNYNVSPVYNIVPEHLKQDWYKKYTMKEPASSVGMLNTIEQYSLKLHPSFYETKHETHGEDEDCEEDDEHQRVVPPPRVMYASKPKA